MENLKLNVGDKIKINKGEVEVITKIENNYAVCKSETYQVVRNISCIRPFEIIK